MVSLQWFHEPMNKYRGAHTLYISFGWEWKKKKKKTLSLYVSQTGIRLHALNKHCQNHYFFNMCFFSQGLAQRTLFILTDCICMGVYLFVLLEEACCGGCFDLRYVQYNVLIPTWVLQLSGLCVLIDSVPVIYLFTFESSKKPASQVC